MSGLIVLLVWPWAALWNGWALSILWGWLIVPVFGGPSLGAWQSAGVVLVAGYLTHQAPHLDHLDKRGEWEKFAGTLAFTAAKPLVALGLGWVISRFL